jgi:hypothetical protein
MSIELEKEVDRLNSKIMMLVRDLDRKHRECAERERQCSCMAEEILNLRGDLKRARDALASALIGLGGQAVGERGEVCLAIDGGNL